MAVILTTTGPDQRPTTDNCHDGGGGGAGDFFIACEDFGRMFDYSFPACASFFFFFFNEAEISSRMLIALFRPDRSVQSGSANRDDCGRVFPGKLSASSFPDRFPHYARTAA